MTRANESTLLDATNGPTIAPESAGTSAAGPATSGHRRSIDYVVADARRLRRALAAATSFMTAWSLFEVPWEFDAGNSHEQMAAVMVAKSLLFIIAACSLRGRRWARYLLLFVCLTSVLAIAPELPAEFERAPWLAILSSVECVAKLAVFVLLALYLKVASKAFLFK